MFFNFMLKALLLLRYLHFCPVFFVITYHYWSLIDVVGVPVVNFELISHLFQVFLLLTLNK